MVADGWSIPKNERRTGRAAVGWCRHFGVEGSLISGSPLSHGRRTSSPATYLSNRKRHTGGSASTPSAKYEKSIKNQPPTPRKSGGVGHPEVQTPFKGIA